MIIMKRPCQTTSLVLVAHTGMAVRLGTVHWAPYFRHRRTFLLLLLDVDRVACGRHRSSMPPFRFFFTRFISKLAKVNLHTRVHTHTRPRPCVQWMNGPPRSDSRSYSSIVIAIRLTNLALYCLRAYCFTACRRIFLPDLASFHLYVSISFSCTDWSCISVIVYFLSSANSSMSCHTVSPFFYHTP